MLRCRNGDLQQGVAQGFSAFDSADQFVAQDRLLLGREGFVKGQFARPQSALFGHPKVDFRLQGRCQFGKISIWLGELDAGNRCRLAELFAPMAKQFTLFVLQRLPCDLLRWAEMQRRLQLSLLLQPLLSELQTLDGG